MMAADASLQLSPPIRSGFAPTEGGLRLWWQVVGEPGSIPPLVCCNGVGVSTFFWKYVLERFSGRTPVMTWDYRGHGRSDRPAHPDAVDLSIGACVRDLARVMDRAELAPSVILGHSMGCQVALQTALDRPDKVKGLVLILGSAGKVLDTFYNTPKSKKAYDVLRRLSNLPGTNTLSRPLVKGPLAWPFVKATYMVDPDYAAEEDFRPYLEHLASLDLRMFLRMVGQAHEHDAFPRLKEISVPTLIIAAERDAFTPLWLSEKMARDIPGAELMVLAGASHAAIIEQPKTINQRIERFIRQKLT